MAAMPLVQSLPPALRPTTKSRMGNSTRCWAAASFPFATWFVYQDLLLLVLAAVIGGLILWQHRTNIVRLVQGKENKLTFHKKKETGV